MARLAAPLMDEGGALFAMSYLGATRVVPNYDLMGPVKAALEATCRYLAHELGPKRIRVHPISPDHPAGRVGPVWGPESRDTGFRGAAPRDRGNTRYPLARWQAPDGRSCPRPFAALVSHVLYQYHHCHVTQPLLCAESDDPAQIRENALTHSSSKKPVTRRSDRLLRRIHNNKSELLLVLERPEIPLHTNGSERHICDHVKKQKITGGTRSELGRRCRDTFSSLKKTSRKLGISFWDYLADRISHTNCIPPPSPHPLAAHRSVHLSRVVPFASLY
jgi:hypothetical protein